jgi:hypothetical protein
VPWHTALGVKLAVLAIEWAPNNSMDNTPISLIDGLFFIAKSYLEMDTR